MRSGGRTCQQRLSSATPGSCGGTSLRPVAIISCGRCPNDTTFSTSSLPRAWSAPLGDARRSCRHPFGGSRPRSEGSVRVCRPARLQFPLEPIVSVRPVYDRLRGTRRVARSVALPADSCRSRGGLAFNSFYPRPGACQRGGVAAQPVRLPPYRRDRRVGAETVTASRRRQTGGDRARGRPGRGFRACQFAASGREA